MFNFEPWAIVLMCVFGAVWLASTIADHVRKSRAKRSSRPPDRPRSERE